MTFKKAIKKLRKINHKITKQRKNILSFFAKTNKHGTAKALYLEIFHIVISFDMIDRNLDLYKDMGILEETGLDAKKYFHMTSKRSHHHYFIDKENGNIKIIDICPMEKVEERLDNYYIKDHKVEVYGLYPQSLNVL